VPDRGARQDGALARGVAASDVWHLKPSDVERRVEDASQWMADLGARSIWVTRLNGTVHLHGRMHSLEESRVCFGPLPPGREWGATTGKTAFEDRLRWSARLSFVS
jgi:hypothetical protein